jgi:hypothetical protein
MQIMMDAATDSNGYLILKIPMAMKNTAFKLMIEATPSVEELGWSHDFFEQTAGACEGELVREQPEYFDIREPLL